MSKFCTKCKRKDQEHLCPWSFKKSFIIYPGSISVILKYRLCRLAVIFRGACCLVIDMRQDSAGINFIFVSIAVLHRRILGDTSGTVYHIRLITAVSIRNADQRITAGTVCLLKFSHIIKVSVLHAVCSAACIGPFIKIKRGLVSVAFFDGHFSFY